MAVKIDADKCGHIDNCPVQGLCIKLCEQGNFVNKAQSLKKMGM